MRKIFGYLPMIAALAFATVGSCGETSDQLMISMNVVAACGLSMASTTLNPGSVAEGDLGVSCSPDQPYAIEFDCGPHAQDEQPRPDYDGAEVADQLYLDSSLRYPLLPQGNTGKLRGPGNGNRHPLLVYRPLTRLCRAGMYADVVLVTLTW